MATATKATEIGPVTNGGKAAIDTSRPYIARFTLRGTCDMLFHRWNCEAVESKANSAKGSKAKKSDNVESYVYRNDDGEICLPGEYARQAIIAAAKFRQDPRSPRKSACDLLKAAVIPLTQLASLGITQWHYEHKSRVQVQRNGVTRTRPAVKSGWEASFEFMVNLPEYVSPELLCEILNDAGRLIGLADFRPTYGRFVVVRFEVSAD